MGDSFWNSKGKGGEFIQRHWGTYDWNSQGMGYFLEETDKSVKAQKHKQTANTTDNYRKEDTRQALINHALNSKIFHF